MKKVFDARPFHVGPLLVKRVPSSSAEYGAFHRHYWHGYLCPEFLGVQWIERFGTLIEVRTKKDLVPECTTYRAKIVTKAAKRLAYYEVVETDDNG